MRVRWLIILVGVLLCPLIASAQTCVQQTPGSPSQVVLNWTAGNPASCTPPCGAVANYNVMRSDTSAGPFTLLVRISGSATSYTDTGVSPNQTYYYQITAQNSVGTTEPTNVACKTMTTPPQPPARPQNLTIALAGSGKGTVTSSPPGINCGTSPNSPCRAEFDQDSLVRLTADPQGASSMFSGWSGGSCAGVAPCNIVMATDTAVIATFMKR